jgi:hypothetical protein
MGSWVGVGGMDVGISGVGRFGCMTVYIVGAGGGMDALKAC